MNMQLCIFHLCHLMNIHDLMFHNLYPPSSIITTFHSFISTKWIFKSMMLISPYQPQCTTIKWISISKQINFPIEYSWAWSQYSIRIKISMLVYFVYEYSWAYVLILHTSKTLHGILFCLWIFMSMYINFTNGISLCMLYFFISFSIITSTIPQCGRWKSCVSFLAVSSVCIFFFYATNNMFVLILTSVIHFIYFPCNSRETSQWCSALWGSVW